MVRSGERDIVHRGNAPPHVDFRLRRRQVGRRIDEPDVGRQRERDPDEAVLAKIAEIAGALAVGPEVIRVDRPEQRIVGIRIPPAPPLQELKPRLHAGWRELETVRRHVTVGAGAAIRGQSIQLPVEERAEAAGDGIAGLTAAVDRVLASRQQASECEHETAAQPAMMMSSQTPSDL